MKAFKYAFLTCTIAYFIGALALFVFSVSQTGWSRIDSDTGRYILTGLTMMLSEFEWWGHYYYLAFLVPWLGSALLLALLLYWFGRKVEWRRWLGGLIVFTYYIAMWLVFIFEGLFHGWGDIAYIILLIWPVAGFLLGYISAIITDKIVEFPVRD
jgi:hypothetical protein